MALENADPYVMVSEEAGGSFRVTVRIGGLHHRFDVYAQNETAYVTFEETMNSRGDISTAEPPLDVFAAIMKSDEVTEILDSHGLKHIRREA